jgi:uncharacterized protein with FMN-binding domain
MRRIMLWLLSTVAALVLLFSYRTSTTGASAAGVGTVANAPGSTGAGGSAAGTASASGTGGSTGAGTGSGGDGSYDGSVVQTRWGPVQVRVTVSGGTLIDVTAVVYPNGNPRDQEINSYALPILRQAALVAQSASIDSVSGATYTSDGYRQSLQSALDAAHR